MSCSHCGKASVLSTSYTHTGGLFYCMRSDRACEKGLQFKCLLYVEGIKLQQ